MRKKAKPETVKQVSGGQLALHAQPETANNHSHEGLIDAKQWNELFNELEQGARDRANFITQMSLNPQLPPAPATPAAPASEPQSEFNRIATGNATSDIPVASMINGSDDSTAQNVERPHPPSQPEQQPVKPVPPEVIPAQDAGKESAKSDSTQEGTTPAPAAGPPKAADPEIAPTDNEQPPNAGNESPNLETGTPPISVAEIGMDQITIAFGADRGVYSVHPVACMFPMSHGKSYEDLTHSIQCNGQQDPCVLDGKVFLDGRNRVKVLNVLGLEPKIIQFADLKTGITPADWVIIKNKERRHLSDNQCLAITLEYQDWCKDEMRRKQAQVKTPKHSAQAPSSDSPNPENAEKNQPQCADESSTSEFQQKPAEIPAKPKRGRPNGDRSAVEELAKTAKQSRYKAEQMVKIKNGSPELAKAVRTGDLTLKEATEQLKAQEPPKKINPQRSVKKDDIAIATKKAQAFLLKVNNNLRADDKAAFWTQIAEFARKQTELSKSEEP